MIALCYKNKTITIPSQWDELTAKQYVRVIKELHARVVNEWLSCDRMLRILSGKNYFTYYLLPADLRWRCYEHMRWVYEKQNVTTQLLPSYRGLIGPAAYFTNTLLKEFHHTEIAYQDYIKHINEADALNKLVAVLYRLPKNKKLYDYKRNPDGDLRQPFNANEIDFYINRVSRWPHAVKLAVFVWYDACREQFFTDYREAFTGGMKKESYAQGLFEMMRSISGGKYGTFKDVEQMPVHTAFLEIIASKREAKELEKNAKKHIA